MFTKVNLIMGGVVVLLLLTTGMFGGWHLRKYLHPDPIITHDTISVVDPYWHHMADSLSGTPPKEVWKWHPRDTIRIPGQIITLPVDSASIRIALEDYLATYSFGHEFSADSLDVNIGVMVNKNRPIAYTWDYKFKIPFNNIINQPQEITNYSSYLQAGITIPLKKDQYNNFSIDGTLVFPKWSGGASWQPTTGGFSAKAAITILKFKTRK